MSFDEYRSPDNFKEENGYEIDGIWYPRITRIVGIKAKPALYRYYAAAPNFAAAESQKEKSAEEGTLVHEMVEKILIGESPIIDPLIAPSIKAFYDFFEANDVLVIPEHIEKRILHPGERYAGTIDALAYVNGKFGILDIKTSQAIYRDYNLQTAAYLGAVKEYPEIAKADSRWILRIDQGETCERCGSTRRTKGGRATIRRGPTVSCPTDEHAWSVIQGVAELKELSDWENDFSAFLGAKRLWEWENDYWLKKIGYL